MRTNDSNKDSGSYINGVYTTKNGFSGTGLNCPKGTRLYRTDLEVPMFLRPDDATVDEKFKTIEQDVAPDIMPYYAVSNFGRVLNYRSGKVMKPNYRPTGYEYYCLAAENCKNGQKKYSTHRMVMMTFEPNEDAEILQVNHMNGDKSNNRLDNLEWNTPSENVQHAWDIGLKEGIKINFNDAKEIRRLRSEGWTYQQIANNYYPDLSVTTIARICKNIEFYDSTYTPIDYDDIKDLNPAKVHKLTYEDAQKIRMLHDKGLNNKEIKQNFYPDFSESSISDIVRGISHNH